MPTHQQLKGTSTSSGSPDPAQPASTNQDLSELAAPPPAHEQRSSDGPSLEREERRAKSQTATPNTLLTQLYTYAYLTFFALLGTLARLGVQWLTFYPGAPVAFANLWANVGGSLVMGFLTEDRRLFRDEWGRSRHEEKPASLDEAEAKQAHAKVKKTIPLFVGLATGFCGSFTSFSTFMRDVFFALANALPTPVSHPTTGPVSVESTVQREGGYSFMAVLAVVLVTVGMSLAALLCGAHVAVAMERVTPTLPFRMMRRCVDPVVLVLGPGCWLGAAFLAIFPPDRPGGPDSGGDWSREVWRGEVLFALVFAPVGCLARYWISLKLNGRVPAFPLGTFLVNMLGTTVLSVCYSLQHVHLASASGLVGGGIVGCQVLQGVEDGFDGCLTTVSTWVLELATLRRKHAYVYGLASVLAGLSLTVIIMGSVKWTIGFEPALCSTGRS